MDKFAMIIFGASGDFDETQANARIVLSVSG